MGRRSLGQLPQQLSWLRSSVVSLSASSSSRLCDPPCRSILGRHFGFWKLPVAWDPFLAFRRTSYNHLPGQAFHLARTSPRPTCAVPTWRAFYLHSFAHLSRAPHHFFHSTFPAIPGKRLN